MVTGSGEQGTRRKPAGECVYGVLTAANGATQGWTLITRMSKGSRVDNSQSSEAAKSICWSATNKTVSKLAMENLQARDKRQVCFP